MSKRAIEFFIVDCFIAIDKVKRYTSEFHNSQEFLHDEKSFDATMRELEILGEATKHLIKSQIIDKEFQIVVDFRNIISHEYFGIDIEEVWEVITIHILDFEKELYNIINNIDKNVLLDVLNSALKDHKYSNDTSKYINKLQKDLLI